MNISDGSVWKQISEQTKRECKNCVYFVKKDNSKREPRGVCLWHHGIYCKSQYYKYGFKQKDLSIVLLEGSLKENCPFYEIEESEECLGCSTMDEETEDEFDGNCEKKIEIKVGDQISFVCGNCKGEGMYLDDMERTIDCSTCSPPNGGQGLGKLEGEVREVSTKGKDVYIKITPSNL